MSRTQTLTIEVELVNGQLPDVVIAHLQHPLDRTYHLELSGKAVVREGHLTISPAKPNRRPDAPIPMLYT